MIKKLQPIIENLFPEREAIKITNLERLEGGLENEVFQAVIAYQTNGNFDKQKMVLRLLSAPDGVNKAKREKAALHQLQRQGYPAPIIYYAETQSDTLGKPFTVTEFIEGSSLQEKLLNHTTPNRSELIASFSRLLARLHHLSPSAASPTLTLHQVIKQQATAIPPEFLPAFAPAFDWLQTQLPQIETWETAVTHNDFTPANVLVRPDGQMIVIDWAGAVNADPRIDLAWTLFTLSLSGLGEWETAVTQQYTRFSGHSITQLDFFTTIAHIRFLTYMAQLSTNPEADSAAIANPFFQTIIRKTLNQFHAISDVNLSALKKSLINVPG